jgi:hypothetical protein
MPEQIGDNAAGVKAAGDVIAAATNARWPMYLRNIKQILRAGGFDDRRYGFGGLMDLLRACQKNGLIRLERDRRGGLRVFQGSALSRGAAAPTQPVPGEIVEIIEPGIVEVSETPADLVSAIDAEVEPQPPVVVDTTAELLGRAKTKRTRTRTPREGGRKPAAKKSAAPARRGSRSKRAVVEAHDESAE